MSVDLGMQSPGIKILLVLRENNEGFGGVSIEEKLCYAGVLCCVRVARVKFNLKPESLKEI